MSSALRHLPLEERIRLVEDLWDSIAADQQALPLSDAQRAELDARLDRYEQDGDCGRSAQDSEESVTLALRIRSEAQQHLQEAARWYEAQRQGLGQEFLSEVASCLHRIAEQPEMFPAMHRDTRRALIRKFPFGIFYRVESQIVVLAVMHASRDPRRWRSRENP